MPHLFYPPVDSPGAWTALPAGDSKFTAASYTPQYRLNGDRVELKGRITVTGGAGVTSGDTVTTMPTGFRPLAARRLSVIPSGTTAVIVSITAVGVMTIASTVSGVTTLDLDQTYFFTT